MYVFSSLEALHRSIKIIILYVSNTNRIAPTYNQSFIKTDKW